MGINISFKTKKRVLYILSLINTYLMAHYFGIDLYNNASNSTLLFDGIGILFAILPFLLIRFTKNKYRIIYAMFFLGMQFVFIKSSLNLLFIFLGILISVFETEKEKGNLNNFIKKYPIRSSIGFTLVGYTGLTSSSLLENIIKIPNGVEMLCELFGLLFVVLLIYATNKKNLILEKCRDKKETFLVILPYLLFMIYIFVTQFCNYYYGGYQLKNGVEVLFLIIFFIFVGLFEDFLMRGLVLNILLDKYGKTRKGIWFAIVLSSLFFGSLHFVNLFGGANFQGVLIQVVGATCIGIYYGAIYVRVNSVWVPAFLHGLWDACASISSMFILRDESLSISEEMTKSISNYSWVSILPDLLYLSLALYLLRPSKMSKIVALNNGREFKEVKRTDFRKAFKIAFFSGSVAIFIFMIFSVFITFKNMNTQFNYVKDNFLFEYDYQDNIDYLFLGKDLDVNDINDEVKMALVFDTIPSSDFIKGDSYKDYEGKKNIDDIETKVKKEVVKKAYKNYFTDVKDEDIKYVDVRISYKTSCSLDKDVYICKTTNNEEENIYKTHYSVNSFELMENGDLSVDLYYFVENKNTLTLYADSSMKKPFKFNYSVGKYDNSKEFFKDFIKRNKEVPKYNLIYTMNLDSSYSLKEIKFVEDSVTIYDTYLEDDRSMYSNLDYSIVYDRDLFMIEREKEYTHFGYEDSFLRIDSINSLDYFDLLRKKNTSIKVMGNNSMYYYKEKNINYYLAYNNGNFYKISYESKDKVLEEEIINMIKSIEFEDA